MNAVYEGDCSIAQLKQHGDFGLGTMNAVDGELVIYDGQFYCCDELGKARLLENHELTPFAIVTRFLPDLEFKIEGITSLNQLNEFIDSKLETLNGMYAVCIAGHFNRVHIRSECAQPKPYRPLIETLSWCENQFNWENITGILVGTRFPDYLYTLNVPSYHFHFIDADSMRGGHVYNICSNTPLSISIASIKTLTFCDIKTAAFKKANISLAELNHLSYLEEKK